MPIRSSEMNETRSVGIVLRVPVCSSLRRATSRLGLPLIALVLCAIGDTNAAPARDDYRYFRALSIDLAGRPPSRDELHAFEQPGFDLDAWIDQHLSGPIYAERIRRIYMDLLRLDLPATVKFEPPSVVLLKGTVLGPAAAPIEVYFRPAQRRVKPEIDGWFCFTQDETGAPGHPTMISQALLDARTVEVKPWWLYADYRAANPKDLITWDWYKRFPGYGFYLRMIADAAGKAPATVRVCREEAQTADIGHVYATGRIVTKRDKLLPGRTTRLPADTAFARLHKGEPIACGTLTAYQSSVECGCGIGLERCMTYDANRFILPIADPLAVDTPFVTAFGTALVWMRQWWTEEPRHFLDKIIGDDLDVRSMLTSRGTMINGPLAQFYRSMASATCCGAPSELGYATPEPLFDPARVPPNLVPEEAAQWTWVPDRGPHAAGLMTMPVFLTKYGSRRARAHVIYNAFMCRDFVAETVKLTPSTEPDLTKRPGCSACHETLEPMAAYFSRITESDWTYLPAKIFPAASERCATSNPAAMTGACKALYDPAFTNEHRAMLRGAYIAPDHADEGPEGLANKIVASPEFPRCVAKNVAQSLIGHALGPDDAGWLDELSKTLVDGGYRMKPLVRAIVTSPRYKLADEHAEAR